MAFLQATLAWALSAGLLGDPVLQALIDEAQARNPALAAAAATALAAEARPIQAGSRPGASLGLFYQNDGARPSLGREPMTMLGVSAGQDLPYPGKLSQRRRVAESEAGLAALDTERARLSLVASVKRAYYGLLLARQLAELALEHREVWQQIQEAARARYASAVGSQQEMLRAQVEITRLHGLHAQHHAEARARLAELNALLGRTMESALDDDDDDDDATGRLGLTPDSRSAAEWIAWSEAQSPELRAASLLVERDERAVSLARLEFKPDFNVQGGVMYRGALPPMWQVAGSLMLPSRGRARGALAEAQARLDSSKARLADLRLRLRSAVEQRLALLQAVEQIEATYRDGLLPQGELTVESARARYASNQGLQSGVLDASSSLLEDRTDYVRLLAAHAMERARLEEASLEPPLTADSLLMHGRSGRMPGEGSMAAPPPMGGTSASSLRTEMR